MLWKCCAEILWKTSGNLQQRVWLRQESPIYFRAAHLQNGIAPEFLSLLRKMARRTQNKDPKNDPKRLRKSCRLKISHLHFQKLFHRPKCAHKKQDFTARICRGGLTQSLSVDCRVFDAQGPTFIKCRLPSFQRSGTYPVALSVPQ